MTAVTVVANLIMCYATALAQYDAAPILIYCLGVLMDPLLAVRPSLWPWHRCRLQDGHLRFPPIFVIGAMVVRGWRRYSSVHSFAGGRVTPEDGE